MKTSYYQSKRIDPKKHFVVQTSVSSARWGAQPEMLLEVLQPPEEILGLEIFPYTRAYTAHLESMGVREIRMSLDIAKDHAGKREVLLCCFESLKKPGQFCHRRIFAWWWHKKTGEFIPELGVEQQDLKLK
jgi:hypothetical protein